MRPAAALFFVVIAAFAAAAADPVVGDKVFVKDRAEAKVGDARVDIERIPSPATVEEVDGDLLWLVRGWVRKDDVLSIDQAVAFFDEQIRDEPKNAKAWRRRGDAWGVKGEYEKSDQDYNEAIRLNPKDAIAYAGRAANELETRRYSDAISDCDTALRLDPKYVNAYLSRGLAWAAKNEHRKALADFKAAIRFDPENPVPYSCRGHTSLSYGQNKDAIADFNEAIRLDKMHGYSYGERGYAWLRMGEYQRAVSDFEAAIRLTPKWNGGYRGLAWLRATSPETEFRDGKKAVELAMKGSELTEWRDADDIAALAAAYAEAGEWENAVKRQKQFIEMATTENDQRDGRIILELYTQHRPYRDVCEDNTPQKPLLLSRFILQNLGNIVVWLVPIAVGCFFLFIVLFYLRDQWIARKNKPVVPQVGTIQPIDVEDIVTIASFRSLPEAEACKVCLESEGLTVLLTDAEMIRTDWLLSNAIGYAKIQVPSAQADIAATILQQVRQRRDEPSNDADDHCCLACGAKISLDTSQCQTCGWSYAKTNEDVVNEAD